MRSALPQVTHPCRPTFPVRHYRPVPLDARSHGTVICMFLVSGVPYAEFSSQSLPLSSFLTCVTVVPPKIVSPVFLTVHQQPFAVVSTANEPFMAKAIFEWVGGGKMEVEHWVEVCELCHRSFMASLPDTKLNFPIIFSSISPSLTLLFSVPNKYLT